MVVSGPFLASAAIRRSETPRATPRKGRDWVPEAGVVGRVYGLKSVEEHIHGSHAMT